MRDLWSYPEGEPFDVGSVIGWRVEDVIFVPALGISRLGSFPRGGWSAPARCSLVYGAYGGRHCAPHPGCECGLRLCRDVDTLLDLMDSCVSTPLELAAPRWNSALPRAIVRVEGRGRALPTSEPGGMASRQLFDVIRVAQIRPIWPAYAVNEAVARSMSGSG